MKKQHAENVFGSKLAAKKDIAAMLWPTLGATVLFLLPIVLISAALTAACGGASVEAVSKLSARQMLTYLGVYVLAHFFIVQPLYYGLTQFYALQRAGARPSVSTVTMCLSSFRLYFRSLRLALVILLFSVLWTIPLVIACSAGFALYRYVLPNGFGWFVCLEIVIVALVAYLCMVMRYHCAYALMTEQPDLGCWEAVCLAARKFRGHNREMFSLTVSFMFWFIMTALIGGLLLVIVCPYFLLSVYHLFDRIRCVQIKIVRRETQQDGTKEE
ncbi:MAG: DUF975 family protein [Eubacteriales bacterium]|nr:DUF975 family protein [Eubacteriales bacterium]